MCMSSATYIMGGTDQHMEHILRKPVESSRAYRQRRKTIVFGIVLTLVLAAALAVLLAGCGGGSGGTSTSGGTAVTPPATPGAPLSAAEVQTLVETAATAVNDDRMVIAVVDRRGDVLAVYRKATAGSTDIGNYGATVDVNDQAVSLARTAAYFSNDQAPLSSRTVRFISGIHFPPGVMNAPTADLYGIENTNRGCTLSMNFLPGQTIDASTALVGVGPGLGIATGKADLLDSDPNAVNPGGVPIFRGATVVGGIGIAGIDRNTAEYAAFSSVAANGFLPPIAQFPPGVVFIGGIALPFVNQTSAPAGVTGGTLTGGYYLSFTPKDSVGQPPEGDLVGPNAGSQLSVAEVKQILDNAEATANTTRAVIRLPIGQRAKMVIAVADLDGTIIGLRRMHDSTIFSIDVAASKARNMIYFNSGSRTTADLNQVPMGTAVTNRTISFGAQPLFPPGINDSNQFGPFYNLFTNDTANPCTQGFEGGVPNANKSGIVFFPGSVGLYKNGLLVGGLGVSGDGVDQDDYVTSGGMAGFEAPTQIRADQVVIENVRLPYLKFPRNPTN
jgi:uncharacterized protein GlcG (DUF336 family)